ncbi:hypothetical protein [Massilia varians]|jgi:hypothetical protein|uniref:hypothetical protein n=1 Tax=Massilia varians TaxID=457921 RepID=UPI002555EB90|nr:hypothetical protein [Massilia varians]MDK6076227.1 hypothetical protein [Massilia varians]
MKLSKHFLKVAVPVFAIGMMVAAPARADTLFERLRTITSNLPVIKDLAIYGFFLAGLVAIGWAGMEMLKKSKGRAGEDTSWGSIGIKFVAGALMVALTGTTDTMTQTFVGTSTTSNSSVNLQ